MSNSTECKAWAEHGACVDNPGFMARECSKACGLCSTVCMDHHESCSGWAADNQCETNKAFMTKECPASCGVCTDLERANKDEI